MPYRIFKSFPALFLLLLYVKYGPLNWELLQWPNRLPVQSNYYMSISQPIKIASWFCNLPLIRLVVWISIVVLFALSSLVKLVKSHSYKESLLSPKWVNFWKIFQQLLSPLRPWRKQAPLIAAECDKMLSTYYVSQFLRFSDPPSPLHQQSSAIAWSPLPPSSAFVSIWPTPPLSMHSRKTHFLLWNDNCILVV